MSPLPHRLLSKLHLLTPGQLVELEEWVGHLCGDQVLCADGDGLAQQTGGEGGVDADGNGSGFSGSEPWIDWLRRPFDGVCHDDLEPITALYRAAVDLRSLNRLRYGAV